MLTDLSRAGAAIDSAEHAGIGSSIDHPVAGGQHVYIATHAHIAVHELNVFRDQLITVPFRAWAQQVVDPIDLRASDSLQQRRREPAADESADTGDKNSHLLGAGRNHGGPAEPQVPGFDNFSEDIFERPSDGPSRIMRLHLAKIAVIADVISDAILIGVGVLLPLAREILDRSKRLEIR